jgi:hypothetical protein
MKYVGTIRRLVCSASEVDMGNSRIRPTRDGRGWGRATNGHVLGFGPETRLGACHLGGLNYVCEAPAPVEFNQAKQTLPRSMSPLGCGSKPVAQQARCTHVAVTVSDEVRGGFRSRDLESYYVRFPAGDVPAIKQ